RRYEVDDETLALRRVDATDSEMMKELFEEIVEVWGGFHMVASLVGGWAGGRDVEETDAVRWERMLDLNLRSAIHTVGPAVPHLRKQGWGRILVVGSRAVDDAPPGQAAFNVAKAGVTALARTLASELEGTGVTANVLAPSVIDTPATRSALPYADYVDWPTPEEIASVADFVLSEHSDVMNGAVIPVYGRA
ncbi:MAG: SDR family oxidoreductase, partial [Acidimicrobiia bacterium]|nr:SDR family oxidoreductase [Acidimicrobiia bacterium]